jgi:hypothetical protein
MFLQDGLQIFCPEARTAEFVWGAFFYPFCWHDLSSSAFLLCLYI